ncbi:esterase [Myxococcota bacterium]|nr:esterase [Myxococcota bacterium]
MPILQLEHQSKILENNRPDDPTKRELWAYLPPSYNSSKNRYPVIWMLPAYGGSGSGLIAGTPWSPGVPAQIQKLIEAGMPEVIAVFPDAFTRFGGSQYINSPAIGNYEDYVCDELIPFVDQELRTLPKSTARGVLGRSSGGYGALRLSMKRPGTFTAFASQSGDLGFSFCYPPDFPSVAAELQNAGSIKNYLRSFDNRAKMRGLDFAVMNTLAMASAYSPNENTEMGFDLPFDIQSAEIMPEVWQRWLQNDPLQMIENKEHQDALRDMRLAFLDCGTRDEHHLYIGMRQFSKKLDELNISHLREEFDDGHRSLGYRQMVSIPKIVSLLDTE